MALSAAQGRASEFDRIKAAAARERYLVVWHNTPKQDTTDQLEKMFNKRFGMHIKVERVPVSGGRMTSRIMSEKRGGKFTVDVFIATDRHLPRMVKYGLVEKVDWVKTFAGPGKIDARLLTDAVNNIIPEFVGYGLEFRHSASGFAYNTKMLARKDVPRTWQELADPKWKRRFTVDAGLSPLARLVPVIGRKAVLDLARKVAANQPIYSDGQPNSATKVVTGEVPLGAMTLSSALDKREKGAPIDLSYPEPQAIISQQVIYVTKGAPHPNLAKLWAAWLASEAMTSDVMVKQGIIRAWPGSPGRFGQDFAKYHLKVHRAATMKELEEATKTPRSRQDRDRTGTLAGRERGHIGGTQHDHLG